jgi:hypothetical protein
MKRASDVFVSVNPNSPRKRRRKKLISYGKTIHFGSTGMASDSPRGPQTHDENLPNATLGSPWTPLPKFKIWDSSKRTGSDFPTPNLPSAQSDVFTQDTTDNNSFTPYTPEDYEIPDDLSHVQPESSPILLKLRNTAKNLGLTHEASDLHVYDILSQTPRNVWKDCKQNVLRMISDASRSPLDLISDILDPTQDEHEQYRSRWFSPARRSKLSDLLDSIFAHPKGRDLILEWMKPHALESVCSTVASEMDLVQKSSLCQA